MDLAYDIKTKSGYDFFDMASLLQKAIRRNDYERAGFAANELYPKYAGYLWRRLLIISAEDCYGVITREIVALKEAEEAMKKPGEESIFVSKAIVLLCMAKKNRDADYFACNLMHSDKPLDPSEIPLEKRIEDCILPGGKIPDWVYNWHTKKGRMDGKDVVDAILEEQEALEPLQMNLFDECTWNKDINSCLERFNPKHYRLPYDDGKKQPGE